MSKFMTGDKICYKNKDWLVIFADKDRYSLECLEDGGCYSGKIQKVDNNSQVISLAPRPKNKIKEKRGLNRKDKRWWNFW